MFFKTSPKSEKGRCCNLDDGDTPEEFWAGPCSVWWRYSEYRRHLHALKGRDKAPLCYSQQSSQEIGFLRFQSIKITPGLVKSSCSPLPPALSHWLEGSWPCQRQGRSRGRFKLVQYLPLQRAKQLCCAQRYSLQSHNSPPNRRCSRDMWISQFRDQVPTARHILKYSWVLMVTTEHRCQIQKALGYRIMMDKAFFFFSEGI